MNFKILSLLIGIWFCTNTHAEIIRIDGSVDLKAGCAGQTSSGACTISENGIILKINCSGGFDAPSGNGELECHSQNYPITITSNAPFSVIAGTNATVMAKDKFNASVNPKRSDYYSRVSSIQFLFGAIGGLTESLQAADGILVSFYSNALNAANMFKGEIAKTHRNHMSRFMTSLSEGIELLDPKNASRVTIVDWRVQENARLIVVFGTIMNELLTDYDDVERLKVAIKTLVTLVDQLRVSYGWDRGLAGNVSKASSALLQVLRLEIQELASIKMAMGESNLTSYTNVLRTSSNLLAKVNASKSGDMKSQREIYELVDAWNSQEFQTELRNLLNAGPDFKNLVLPKLTMLLKSVESINDLADAGLVIPDATSSNEGVVAKKEEASKSAKSKNK